MVHFADSSCLCILCWSLIIPGYSIFISLVISCWIILLTLPYFISRLDIFHSGFRAFRDGPLDNLLEGLKDRPKTTVLSSKENGTDGTVMV